MLKKTIPPALLSLAFTQNLLALDYMKDKIWGASRVDLFSKPQDYAECISQFTQDPPVLTAQNIKNNPLDQLIPVYHYQLVNPTHTIGKEIDLLSGERKVRCSIDYFSLTHYHTTFDYPVQAGSIYLASYILPTILVTPVLTTALIAGTGYLGYRLWQEGFLQELLNNQDSKKSDAPQDEKWSKLSTLMNSFGIGNNLSQIIGSHSLMPQYSANGKHLIYEGELTDGIIPGKKTRYKIILKLQGYVS